MASRVQLEYKGKLVNGEIVDFDVEKEPWSAYSLGDGTKLKMRSVVAQVIRIEGEYDAQGDPIYFVKSQNLLSAEVPDDLKKKPPGKVN